MRTAKIERSTKETQIKLSIDLDNGAESKITTGVGFFDHMLTLFAVHSGINLHIEAKGDIEVDCHHLVEDVGICFGLVLREALGDKRGIQRYSNISLPMDECLCDVALDISGRAYFVYNVSLSGKSGEFDTELMEEFLRAVAVNAGLTLHINLRYGVNRHHIAEAVIKGFARTLGNAVKIVSDKIPSSKGAL